MQSCLLIKQTGATSRDVVLAKSLPDDTVAADRNLILALCLAQRAFTVLIEHATGDRGAAMGMLGAAQLRSVARRTLSVLSADDRSRLARWLALQFAARNLPASHLLERVDAVLGARVCAMLARTREELMARRSHEGVVAA